MDSANEPSRDATFFHIAAQFARENQARDLEIGRLKAMCDMVPELQRLVEGLRSAGERVALIPPVFTPEEVRTVQRLCDAAKQRGSVDLFTDNEMEIIRARLRQMDTNDKAVSELQQHLAALDRYKDQIDARAEQFMAQLAKVDESYKSLIAWRSGHDSVVQDMQRQIARLEGMPRFTASEQEQARLLMAEWVDFKTNFVDAVKQIVEDFQKRKGLRYANEEWKRQTAIVISITFLLNIALYLVQALLRATGHIPS